MRSYHLMQPFGRLCHEMGRMKEKKKYTVPSATIIHVYKHKQIPSASSSSFKPKLVHISYFKCKIYACMHFISFYAMTYHHLKWCTRRRRVGEDFITKSMSAFKMKMMCPLDYSHCKLSQKMHKNCVHLATCVYVCVWFSELNIIIIMFIIYFVFVLLFFRKKWCPYALMDRVITHEICLLTNSTKKLCHTLFNHFSQQQLIFGFTHVKSRWSLLSCSWMHRNNAHPSSIHIYADRALLLQTRCDDWAHIYIMCVIRVSLQLHQ